MLHVIVGSGLLPSQEHEIGNRAVKAGYVYIMASQRNGTLYIGSTSDLVQRIWQHREKVVPGFTQRYGCTMLVWFEAHDDLDAARWRELQMKKWKRLWKLRVIEEGNPEWRDLWDDINR